MLLTMRCQSINGRVVRCLSCFLRLSTSVQTQVVLCLSLNLAAAIQTSCRGVPACVQTDCAISAFHNFGVYWQYIAG